MTGFPHVTEAYIFLAEKQVALLAQDQAQFLPVDQVEKLGKTDQVVRVTGKVLLTH
jgi:hypothetical protein